MLLKKLLKFHLFLRQADFPSHLDKCMHWRLSTYHPLLSFIVYVFILVLLNFEFLINQIVDSFIRCSSNEVSNFLKLHFYHCVSWTSIVLYIHLCSPPFHLLFFLIYIIFNTSSIIVVTYEMRVFFEGAQKEVFSSILKFENVKYVNTMSKTLSKLSLSCAQTLHN